MPTSLAPTVSIIFSDFNCLQLHQPGVNMHKSNAVCSHSRATISFDKRVTRPSAEPNPKAHSVFRLTKWMQIEFHAISSCGSGYGATSSVHEFHQRRHKSQSNQRALRTHIRDHFPLHLKVAKQSSSGRNGISNGILQIEIIFNYPSFAVV